MRHATEAEWHATTLILRPGEAGRASDTGSLRFGDGVHRWPQLPAVATIPGDDGNPQTPPPAPDNEDWPDLTVYAEAAMQ